MFFREVSRQFDHILRDVQNEVIVPILIKKRF